MSDIHGRAIADYFHGKKEVELILHNSYGSPEEMPVEVFFRDDLDFSTLEHLALIESKGKILDLGAGAGAHSLVLQSRGFEVVALENSPGCVEVMKGLGVRNIVHENFQLHLGTYDTLLVLMNGLGLSGTLAQVPAFLRKCMTLLNPSGQLLIDSSDITYLYDSVPKKTDAYFGDIRYQYEYLNEKGGWFDWVYVDQAKLEMITHELNLDLEILITEDNDQYLARISKDS